MSSPLESKLFLWWNPQRVGGFNLPLNDIPKGKHLGQFFLNVKFRDGFIIIKNGSTQFSCFSKHLQNLVLSEVDQNPIQNI